MGIQRYCEVAGQPSFRHDRVLESLGECMQPLDWPVPDPWPSVLGTNNFRDLHVLSGLLSRSVHRHRQYGLDGVHKPHARR